MIGIIADTHGLLRPEAIDALRGASRIIHAGDGGSVEILAAEKTLTGNGWYQGTADAVRRQMGRILSRTPRDALILSGDHLYRMDYGEFLRVHRESGADVTISVLPVSAADAPRYGILKTNQEARNLYEKLEFRLINELTLVNWSLPG